MRTSVLLTACLLIVALLTGCAVKTAENVRSLSYWRELARERLLAGESTAHFERYQREFTNGQKSLNLPDMVKLVTSESGEKAAELSLSVLHDCMLSASVLLIPEGVSRSEYAQDLFGRQLDWRSALILSEKVLSDSDPWKDPAASEREYELHSEITLHFGKIPGSPVMLEEPQPVNVSPMPDEIRDIYGKEPVSLLKLGAVILALPGEFAKQLILTPGSNINGIWLEAQRTAVLAALHISERELAAAWHAFCKERSARNVFRYRKWFYRREMFISSMPMMRGTADDFKAWKSMLLLQNHF